MEKKMLISELGKIALILVLVLLPGGIKSQNKPYFDFYLDISFGLGVSHSKQSLEPSYNWQENFEKVKEFEGGGEWRKKDKILKGDFLVGLEPALVWNDFQIGLPINFSLASIIRKTSTKIMLDWPDGDNTVRLKDVIFRPQSPFFGISAEFGWNTKLWLQFLACNYKVLERNYHGHKDPVYSGYRYYTEVYDKTKIGTEWSQKFSIGVMDSDESCFAVYVERVKNYFEVGISINTRVSLLGGSSGGTYYPPCPRPQQNCY